MARGPDRTDGRHSPEEGGDDATGRADDIDERAETRPHSELRWVQLREPRRTADLGPDGRVVASHYHARYDAWEVLLETYEGELSERGRSTERERSE